MKLSKWSAAIGASRCVEAVCALSGSFSLVEDAQRGAREVGLSRAVKDRDTKRIFEWLVDVASYQGVSDTVANTYMDTHGRARAEDMLEALSVSSCPKLNSYWQFDSCKFHKTSRTCSMPEHIDVCSVPRLGLRNGRLCQTAHALSLFVRDIANDDIVGWIDSRLAKAAGQADDLAARGERLRTAIAEPLGHVHGISNKVVSMALAELLIGADPERALWVEAGAAMIAIDTLVHNWLHRTGILRDLDAEHPYGPRCYSQGGCAEIIEQFARGIDARDFNSSYPAFFPRFIQKAIWRFCAQSGFNQCNGNRVDDSHGCRRSDCALGDQCGRVSLRLREPGAN